MVNRIRELREQKGFTQQGLALALGSHVVTISKLERGDMQLTQTWMERLSLALGVSARELLDQPDDTGRRLAAIETKLDRLMAHLGIKED